MFWKRRNKSIQIIINVSNVDLDQLIKIGEQSEKW
jgi:hypothetical protein